LGNQVVETAGTGDAEVGDPSQKSDADFNKLLRQKAGWKQKATEFETKFNTLQDQVSELRGQVSSQTQGNGSSYPSSFSDMSPDQLREAYSLGQDQGSPDASLMAIREMIRREMKDEISTAQKAGIQAVEHRQLRENVFSQVHQDFGTNGQLVEDDPVTQTASQISSGLKGIYGEDFADKQPHLLHYAFLQADRMVNGPKARQEVQDLRNQVDSLKRQQMSATGGGPISQPNDKVREALKNGDVRGAIGQLGMLRRMRGEQ